ncbi:MAG: signal peptidase I [bacterium]|nr:signal peptidase I [bacterium]
MDSSSSQPHTHSAKAFWIEVIRTFLIALAIALPLKWYVAQPYLVFGHSMDPNFAPNDYLIVSRLSYVNNDPQRGDVIVFEYPKDRSQRFIKRIIGLPGESIEFIDGVPVITTKVGNQFELPEPYLTFNDALDLPPRKLGENEYFVAGDNRPKSSDSRLWGPVPRDHIVGEVFVRLFPFSNIKYLPGDVNKIEQ